MATLILPRFAGSTLEPSTEPIVIRPTLHHPPPPHHHHHRHYPTAYSPQAKASVKVEPTRCTKPLCRKNKPASIAIPDPSEVSDEDTFSDENEEAAADQPWLIWDEETQSIKVAPRYRNYGDIPPWIMSALLSPYSDDDSSSTTSSCN